MAKFKDFDNFYKDQKSVLLVFSLFHTKYTMPASMPAKLMIEILRGQKEKDLDPGVVLNICESLLGKDQLEDLMIKGFTVQQMEDVIEWAAAEYGNPNSKDETTDNKTIESKNGDKENFQIQK
jgi:hypothetical protein